MSHLCRSVALKDFLIKSDELIPINPDQIYYEVNVRWWGKGVVKRRQVTGAEIIADSRFIVRPQQFIISRIDARNGAYGLIPDSLDGAVVTNDFPVFNLNTSVVFPRYLDWLSKTQRFIDICSAASEGTTNRVRLKEDRFLSTKITLPPLDEQRRISALLDEIAIKVEEANTLRQNIRTATENLCSSILFEKSVNSTPVAMKELVRLRPLDVNVSKEETYHFAGVYSFGRGIFKGHIKSGTDFAYNRLTRLRMGNFVYPKLMAWEGALGVVPPECDGLVVSPEFPVFEVNERAVLPEVLDVYFRTSSVWPILSGTSTGTNVRRRRLNPSTFLEFKMPIPPMSVQQKIREVKNKLDALKPLQEETSTELSALLKSSLDKAFKGEL